MWRMVLNGAALAFVTGSAFAEADGPNAAVGGGLNFLDPLPSQASALFQPAPIGNGKSYGAVYGFDLGNGFKTEVEGVGSLSEPADPRLLPLTGNLNTSRVALKGLYEFTNGDWHIKPYLGAGFGFTDLNARMLGIAGSDWTADYQLHGGVSLGFTQKLIGSLEYRWTMGSKPNFALAGIPTKLEIDRHRLVLGFNYKY